MIATAAIVFECIDGKDDRLALTVEPGQNIVLGPPGANENSLQELETHSGIIVLTHQDSHLQINAAECTASVKINGSPVTVATLRPTDVLRIGNSIWKAVYPDLEPITPSSAANNKTNFDTTAIRNKFSNLIGLEELKDFKLKNIFSQVFKKHTLVEMEDQLVTGTMSNTPALTDIETDWAKPWLFFRMLVLSVVIDFVLIMGYHTFNNTNFIPGIIFVGSFAVPVATLMFFLEMNVPRNISIFVVMVFLFAGGVASLIVTSIFFDRLDFISRVLGTPAAGIIEETAKILCVILLINKLSRYKWILNGLLIGAAFGTGFAAFESSGYALNFALQSGSFDTGIDIIVMRGILAPFGHIIWTGNAAAALWIVKGDKSFQWSMLKDIRFIRVFLSSVVLHFLWDTDFSILSLPFVGDLKLVILGVLGWVITFRLIQVGLQQLNNARKLEIERLTAN